MPLTLLCEIHNRQQALLFTKWARCTQSHVVLAACRRTFWGFDGSRGHLWVLQWLARMHSQHSPWTWHALPCRNRFLYKPLLLYYQQPAHHIMGSSAASGWALSCCWHVKKRQAMARPYGSASQLSGTPPSKSQRYIGCNSVCKKEEEKKRLRLSVSI